MVSFFTREFLRDRRRSNREKTERTIIDSRKAKDPGHFHAPVPFSFPFPHPSIYLPSTHPSPLSPLSPCRAGPAFHLLSVPARSSPIPPSHAFTIQLKATSPFFYLPLLFLFSSSSSSSTSSSSPFFSFAWMSTAERPIPHVVMQS